MYQNIHYRLQYRHIPFQEELLLEILIHFEEGGRKSYPKAVEATLSHHGLGQGQGQA